MEESGAGTLLQAADESIGGNNKTPHSSAISIYLANIGGVLRIITVIWIKHMMHHYTLSVSIGDGGGGSSAFKVELKAWPFWSRKGSKLLDVYRMQVDVSWNFRHAKFADGPEPLEGYYVVLVADEEAALLLGDRRKKAYKKTRSRPPLEEATLLWKKENVLGKKHFTARVCLDGGGRDHEIVVENSIPSSSSSASTAGEGRDAAEAAAAAATPEISVSVDGIVVIRVSNLQWKFRGNETVRVEQSPVQVMWDVHDWVFRGHGLGHAFFIFKPGMPPPQPPPPMEPAPDDEEDGGGGGSEEPQGGGKMNSGDSAGSSSSSEFCFFMHAWKMD